MACVFYFFSTLGCVLGGNLAGVLLNFETGEFERYEFFFRWGSVIVTISVVDR